MKRLFLFFAAMCCMMVANAQQFTDANGIKYNVTSTENKTVEVIANKYSGSIVIPATVTNNEVTYSVTGIGESAFKDCKTLTSVTMPDGMATIGTSAFQNCSQLMSITFPSSVTSIGTSAFTGCDNLILAKLLGTSVPWTSKTFTNSGENVGGKSFLVPAGAVNAYKNAGWSPTYSSTLAGDELQALKETFLTEISNAVTAEPRLTDNEKSSIETWKTTMMNAADIEATLNARAQAFLVISKRTGMYIVHHLASEPTYTTVGYTQECWEDTETGKLYAEKALTTELNRAVVVTYKKLRKDQVVNFNRWGVDSPDYFVAISQIEDETYEDCPFYWDAKFEFYPYAPGAQYKDELHAAAYFKAHGTDIANARLKFFWNTRIMHLTGGGDTDHTYSIKIKIGDQVVFEKDKNSPLLWENMPHVFEVPLLGLKTDDVVTFEMIRVSNSGEWGAFAACLEYTSTNGGDPDEPVIIPDDKRKFKGVDDPELTYSVPYGSFDEKVSGIDLTRDPGEEPGIYTIHASLAEGSNPDYDILLKDGKLEIVDGVHHEKGDKYTSGLIYLQDCWEETATRKHYADKYLENEIKGIIYAYPNPITSTKGFTTKESAYLGGVLSSWVAEAQYSSHKDTDTRFVEFTVKECGIISDARLKWYKDCPEAEYGPFTITVYVNNNPVECYTQNNGERLSGSHTVSLPGLKRGDVVKFEVQRASRVIWAGTPYVAACLEYTLHPEFYLMAQEASSTIQLNKVGNPYDTSLEYSTNIGKNWQPYTFGQTITLTDAGDRVFFRNASDEPAKGFSKGFNDYYQFVMTGSIAASGNVMSLLDKTCNSTTFPAESVGTFACLFSGCESLTSAPELPAMTLAQGCYYWMFNGCTGLTSAPELPAMTLAYGCYQAMYDNCTGLKQVPALPATTMETFCYAAMFRGCTSLTEAPELSTTTLEFGCYSEMFYGCTSLETAPELPVTTLQQSCYDRMFYGCTSLTTAPELPATTLPNRCYDQMFSGCTKLSQVKVAFTEWTNNTTYNWLKDVASTGTFVCPIGLDKTKTGASYIPEGWTICSPITISAAGMATLCLPFDAVCSEGATAFYATAVDNEGVTFSPVNDGLIKAGQGVLVKGNAGSYLVEKTTGAEAPTMNYMVGVTSETEWPGTDNYILVNGSEGVGFYRWDTGSLAAYKAYLPVPEGATPSSSIAIRFDDGSTTIDDVISEPENEVIYDLQGRRVMNADKGLYIVNGKKVLKR